MRRLLVLCLSAALLVGAAAPAYAGKPVKYDSEYRGASGQWTVVESVGRNGTRITSYYVGAFVGTDWTGGDVYFDTTLCRTTARNTTCEFEGWGYGWSDGPTVDIASDLTSGWISGTFRIERYDARGRLVGAANEQLTASFTGTGTIQTARGSFTYRGGCYSFRTTYTDAWRDATATASLGGRDLGTSDYAGMSAGSSRTMERSC